jgi:hypothetical protein
MQKVRIQLGLLIAITAGTAFGQPVITSANPNFLVNPPTLTINGKNFGAIKRSTSEPGLPAWLSTAPISGWRTPLATRLASYRAPASQFKHCRGH